MAKSIETKIYLKNSYKDRDILDLMNYFKNSYSFIPKEFGVEYLIWGQYLKNHLQSFSATGSHLISLSQEIWILFYELKKNKVEITLEEVHKYFVLKSIQNVDKPCCQVCGKNIDSIRICDACETLIAS